MNPHKEEYFENSVCQSLAKTGWLYTPPQNSTISPDASGFNSRYGLFPADLEAWLSQTQSKAWAELKQKYASNVTVELMARLRKNLDKSGTLHTLKKGLDIIGLRSPLFLAQFKPASSMNETLNSNYQANRLRVIRQLHYSPVDPKLSLDLTFFLNGIPVATAELKSDFTQDVEMAEIQYRKSRNPDNVPLLSFPGGALVHFAASQSLVQMTTRLEKDETCFLPFNMGRDGDAGNPYNPNGFSTDYLWNEILAPESWLDIIGNYIVEEQDSNHKPKRLIFPRYHQLDATRKIKADILKKGPGSKYLIQHSAGSGKTHSIAWTAHQLAQLHDDKDKKIFDSVIVVSDRNVLDEQLQEALIEHSSMPGVVATVKGKKKSKSKELAEELTQKKAIIACTLQTFPFTLEHIRNGAKTKGKNFAVIVDEAHSSQTTKTAVNFKRTLSESSSSETETETETETDIEDLIIDEMERLASKDSISYVAFTATPKNRTLQLFGTLPNPELPPDSENNKPQPFHVYSMQQAIKEKFILDVLANYTNFEFAFKLAQESTKKYPLIDSDKGRKSINNWVYCGTQHTHSHVIRIVEHFRDIVEPLLNQKAKAMVVTSSRSEAVRWHLAMSEYIKTQGYNIKSLVAFSGEVTDFDTSDVAMSETSPLLNPGLKNRSIRKVFSSPENEYQILIVADKFQTGFDEPLLCAMYVHKPLADIKAVQTLSRLNRIYPGKNKAYVVDFINKPEVILKAFKLYYKEAELKTLSDPEIVYDLKDDLDKAGFYDDQDIEKFANHYYSKDPANKTKALGLIEEVAKKIVSEFNKASRILNDYIQKDLEGDPVAINATSTIERIKLFKKNLKLFADQYTFFSQIVDYKNTAMPKRAIFYDLLYMRLKFDEPSEEIELPTISIENYLLVKKTDQSLILDEGQSLDEEIISKGLKLSSSSTIDKLIEKSNQSNWKDKVKSPELELKVFILNFLISQPKLQEQAKSNSLEQFKNSADLGDFLTKALMAGIEEEQFKELIPNLLKDIELRENLKKDLLIDLNLYDRLKESL